MVSVKWVTEGPIRSMLLALCGLCACPAPCDNPVRNTGLWTMPEGFEPSGIVWHDSRGTLFVVGDQGQVLELDTTGEVLRQVDLGSQDFEGATVDPSTGMLYAAIEGDDVIAELDPDSLEVLREFAVQRIFEGTTIFDPGGEGLEGLTFAPDDDHAEGGTFWVSNQSFDVSTDIDPSVVVELEAALRTTTGDGQVATILQVIDLDVPDISGLMWDGSLRAISDVADALLDVTADGAGDSCPLAGFDQEGVATDGTVIYVADETGTVLLFE